MLGKTHLGLTIKDGFENERGLKFIGRVTCSFPWGRLGWVALGKVRMVLAEVSGRTTS